MSSFFILYFRHKIRYRGILIKTIETIANIRLLIIFLNMALALANCEEELCGSIPNISAISL